MNENSNEHNNSESSEYRYSRDNIPHRSYMDANFRTESEDTGSFYTSPQNSDKYIRKDNKGKKGKGVSKFIAACLICALLGGAAGGAVVWTVMDNFGEGQPEGSSGLDIADSISEVEEEAPVVDGEVLSGSQIYTLGCGQTVGVTTEITYTNFLGIQTSTAVSGSGFVATGDGFIVTNYHVIEDAYEGGYDISVIFYNGDVYKAEIVGVEGDNDIAVLKIDASGLTAVTFGNSTDVLVGNKVYAIGNPLGELNFSMTSGMVSALDREITTKNIDGTTTSLNMFQIDAAVNQGNSGGPVYNDRGQVIGIVTAKYQDTGVEGLGFAIPVDNVTFVIDELIEKGYVSGKAYLGITVETFNKAVAEYYNMAEGANILAVEEGSCSDVAGLKVGDIITDFNGAGISSSTDLISAKQGYKAGDTVTVKIFRGGEYIDFELTLDEEQPRRANSSENRTSPGDSLPAVPKN